MAASRTTHPSGHDPGGASVTLDGNRYVRGLWYRLALGVLVVLDAAQRAMDAHAHYAEGGVVPRGSLAVEFPQLHDLGWSLHLATGHGLGQLALLGLALASGVMICRGRQVRLWLWIAWALTSSVQLRNLYVGGGWDAALRLALLWAALAPEETWHRRRAREAESRQGSGAWHEPANLCERISRAGHLVLVASMVGLAGHAKLDHEAWQAGTAVARIGLDAQHVTWVRPEADLSWVPTGLVRLVPWLEMAGALGLLVTVRWPRLRAMVALALLSMVLGFGALLYIGLFPWVVAALLVPYLGALAPWLRRVGAGGLARLEALAGWDQEVERATRGSVTPRGRDIVCAVFGALLLAWHVDWHVRTVRGGGPAPSVVAAFGETFFLQQGWQMFASPPERVGRLEVVGRLRDGRGVDLLAAGGRRPGDDAILDGTETPSQFRTPGDAANVRWYTLLRRLAYGATPALPMHYARYLCREWNATHSGGDALETLDMRFFWRATTTPGTGENRAGEDGTGPNGTPKDDVEREDHLWSHGCFR